MWLYLNIHSNFLNVTLKRWEELYGLMIEEEDTKLLLWMSIAQTLKKRLEAIQAVKPRKKTKSELKLIVEEYRKIRAYLCDNYDDACDLLPDPESISTIEDAKYAIEQLVNYTTSKSVNLIFKLMNMFGNIAIPQIDQPLAPLLPLLREWGLSLNWAVAASALALIEVMINKKLEELGLDTSGSFNDRVKRLEAEAKRRGAKEFPNLLAGPFYNARNKVIHAGKEPTVDELKLIIDYLNLLSKELKSI